MHQDSQKLAHYICEKSQHAQVGGETFEPPRLCEALGIMKEDLDLAANELEGEGLVRVHCSLGGDYFVMAEAELFRRLDPEVKGWGAAEDAVTVAREIVKTQGGSQTSAIAETLGWDPRRMNPACQELYSRDSKCARQYMGSSPFSYGHLMPTDAIRRLARDGQ